MAQYLDDRPAKAPGKFQGESEAAVYIYEGVTSGLNSPEEDFSSEGEGYFVLYVRNDAYVPDRALKYPAYILRESNETGFVFLTDYEDIEEARETFEKLREEAGQ